MAERDIRIEEMSLYQKLAKIRKLTEVIQKDKTGYGYKYVSINEVLSHVTAGMNKYHVSVIPHIGADVSVSPYTYTKTKVVNKERLEEPVTEFYAFIPITYTWVNNDNPSDQIACPWATAGSQSDPSQAMGSALTYGLRYFLCQYFQIATPEDDPDNWRSKQKEAGDSEDRALAKAIIDDLDKMVREYLAANSGRADDVKKFMSKYVKNGNYKAITECAVATKVVDDFKKEFLAAVSESEA